MFISYYRNSYGGFDDCVALRAAYKSIIRNKTTARAYGFGYRRLLANCRRFLRLIARQAKAVMGDSPAAGCALVFSHGDR